MKEYTITKDQLDDFDHYKRMFELNAETIQELCRTERDDVVYGFELGKMHSHLRDCYLEMMNLIDEVRKQEL